MTELDLRRVPGRNKTHRGSLYTRMSKRKALFGYPNLAYWCMTIRGWSRRMYQFLWVKCTTPTWCKSIRIAVSAVMDGWSWFCRAVLDLSFWKACYGKRWNGDCTRKVRIKVKSGYVSTWCWRVELKLWFPHSYGALPSSKEVYKTILSFLTMI